MPDIYPSITSPSNVPTGSYIQGIQGTGGGSGPWVDWINQQYIRTITTNTAQVQTWDIWQNQTTIQTQTFGNSPQIYTPAFTISNPLPQPIVDPLTDIQREFRRTRQGLISKNRVHARLLRQKFAEKRAKALLMECLTAEQQADLERKKYFDVVTKDGLRKYRIDYGTAGNVRLVAVKGEIPNRRPISGQGVGRIRKGASFCMHVVHPEGGIPHYDNMLAQKLLIETDEIEFLTLANAS